MCSIRVQLSRYREAHSHGLIPTPGLRGDEYRYSSIAARDLDDEAGRRRSTAEDELAPELSVSGWQSGGE